MKKFNIGIACAVVFLVMSVFIAYSIFNNITWSYSRSFSKQEILVNAYLMYYKDKGEFPSSLEEIVREKYLPEYGEFYLEPNSLFTYRVHYLDSSYKIFPMMADHSNCLNIIGEKRPIAGQSDYKFLPEINAYIRDAIDKRVDFRRNR